MPVTIKKQVNWGILGCGKIARQFAAALLHTPESILYGVASHNLENAESFAQEFGVTRSYGAYDDLLQLSEIDVVYVANCNTQHFDTVKNVMMQGKSVLCEKPLTTNAVQAKELLEIAKQKNVFLMEAMWMRFHPAIQAAQKLVDDGEIGEIRIIKADFGYKNAEGPLSRQLNRSLGGGATLDVGVYPLHLASLFFRRQPVKIQCAGYIGETGVDEYAAYVLSYDCGKIALLSASIVMQTSQDAEIIGTKGRIIIPEFWRAQKIILYKNSEKETLISFPHKCNGFEYEIKEVNMCIQQGRLESDVMPWRETMSVATLVDKIYCLLDLKLI